MNRSQLDKLVQQSLNTELEGIREAINRIRPTLPDAIEQLQETTGKVVVIGVGKSGLVGQKIAATLSSTGKPAMFLHPVEALHGDLGAVQHGDCVLMLSNSGSSREIAALMPVLTSRGLPIVAITGHAQSLLARGATITLCTGVLQEACPLGLAPTTSTTAALVIGDLLAIALMEESGFKKKDFAERHPAGKLGQQLITVESVMRSGEHLPLVQIDVPFEKVARAIDRGGIGTVGVTNGDGMLVGVITDGDLRRRTMKGPDCFALTAEQIMGRKPKQVDRQITLEELLDRFEKFKVMTLFIIDANSMPLGIVHLHDVIEMRS